MDLGCHGFNPAYLEIIPRITPARCGDLGARPIGGGKSLPRWGQRPYILGRRCTHH